MLVRVAVSTIGKSESRPRIAKPLNLPLRMSLVFPPVGGPSDAVPHQLLYVYINMLMMLPKEDY